MTQASMLTHLRVIMLAAIAFAAGRGWLSSGDSSMLVSILEPIGFLAGPIIWHFYSTYGMKLVPHDSTAIQIIGGSTATVLDGAKIGDHIQSGEIGPAKIVGALMIFFVLFSWPDPARAAPLSAPCNITTLFIGLTAQNFRQRLQACGAADFQAALDDANTAPIDNIAIACLQPATQIVKALEGLNSGESGLIAAFQKFRRAKQSGFVGACTSYVNTTILLQ